MSKTNILIIGDDKNTTDKSISFDDLIKLECFKKLKHKTSMKNIFEIGDLIIYENKNELINGVLYNYIAYNNKINRSYLVSKLDKYNIKLGLGIGKNLDPTESDGCNCTVVTSCPAGPGAGLCCNTCGKGGPDGDCTFYPDQYECYQSGVQIDGCKCRLKPTPCPPTPACTRTHCQACDGPATCAGNDHCKCRECGPDMRCTIRVHGSGLRSCHGPGASCTNNLGGCHCRCNHGTGWSKKDGKCVPKSEVTEEEWSEILKNEQELNSKGC